MRTTVIIAVLTLLAAFQPQARQSYDLREVVVNGRRPAKDIGIQKTVFDSLALKENIALSMADILTYNSSVFVKNHGRATLSTVAFRGTSPSHTQVTWNGMRINSPMLGMTDFSIIPAYFVDKASLLHGTSSVNETGGGLGGLVSLGTAPEAQKGMKISYVQGIGSFRTFDEFLHFNYARDKWIFSTRAVVSTSPNDYKYINHDKKENIYDDNHNIVGQYHPEERNRSGAFRDIHILQEIYYTPGPADRLSLSAWYTDSDRELPLLTTDYGDDTDFDNSQRERTLRAVLAWKRSLNRHNINARAGYIHTWLAYDYSREIGSGNRAQMTRSRSVVNTFFGRFDWEWAPSRRWSFTAGATSHQHLVRSRDKNIILQDGGKAIVGYDKGRFELSASASARWQPVDRLGMSLVLREELSGDKVSPVIPAFFIDGLVSPKGNIMLKASVSRNYRFPSLNDLYFLPGGNPSLRSESGFTYDAGASFSTRIGSLLTVDGSATWFDSRIDDWILWLPTPKGFFSPRNVKKVHAYGVELKSSLVICPAEEWLIDLGGSFSWTPSVNAGDKMTDADRSVGKQLPYVPKRSASATGRLVWRDWSFLYKWASYSQRYTMSSNDMTLTGHLPAYYMSNISLEKRLSFRRIDLQLRLAVNNLFDEDYLSVLSHPMPGINFEFFVGFTLR